MTNRFVLHYTTAKKNEMMIDRNGKWRVPHPHNFSSLRATRNKANVTCKKCIKALGLKL